MVRRRPLPISNSTRMWTPGRSRSRQAALAWLQSSPGSAEYPPTLCMLLPARRRPCPLESCLAGAVQKGLELQRHSSPSHAHRLKGKERGSSSRTQPVPLLRHAPLTSPGRPPLLSDGGCGWPLSSRQPPLGPVVRGEAPTNLPRDGALETSTWWLSGGNGRFGRPRTQRAVMSS